MLTKAERKAVKADIKGGEITEETLGRLKQMRRELFIAFAQEDFSYAKNMMDTASDEQILILYKRYQKTQTAEGREEAEKARAKLRKMRDELFTALAHEDHPNAWVVFYRAPRRIRAMHKQYQQTGETPKLPRDVLSTFSITPAVAQGFDPFAKSAARRPSGRD